MRGVAGVSHLTSVQVHLAAFMALEDQLPSVVHAAPAEEQRSYAQHTANVIAQKDLRGGEATGTVED